MATGRPTDTAALTYNLRCRPKLGTTVKASWVKATYGAKGRRF